MFHPSSFNLRGGANACVVVGTGSTLCAHNVGALLCALEFVFNKSIFH